MSTARLRLAGRDELSALTDIDNAASGLYAGIGLALSLGSDHPFVSAEVDRWSRALQLERVCVAVDLSDKPIGFVALGKVDGQPYLDQLSVHSDNMRQGVGGKLLRWALDWRAQEPIWLTTYAHVPWNQPFYARHGFTAMAEIDCGPQLRDILADQRAVLPAPEHRIAMVCR